MLYLELKQYGSADEIPTETVVREVIALVEKTLYDFTGVENQDVEFDYRSGSHLSVSKYTYVLVVDVDKKGVEGCKLPVARWITENLPKILGCEPNECKVRIRLQDAVFV